MEKYIRQIYVRMSVIAIALVVLGVWQYEFIWNAVSHNIYVNVAIFGTIIAGVVVAFYNVSRLSTEIVAFKALQEMWQDTRDGPEKALADPFWRHYRCMKPGIVFPRPRILGHVYDLVTEEIARTQHFTISIETMQTLIHKIDAKLHEERSLLNYMSGLLVFMGLIGTFLGLLRMVGSIAGILGGLQSSMSGGNSADGFGQLLTELQEPLAGMAVGFGSSLFGLFGSLVIGLLGRYAFQAASQLKVEFESWLAALAQLEGGSLPSAGGVQVIQTGSTPETGRMLRLMTDMSQEISKSTKIFEGAVLQLGRLAEKQEQTGEAIGALSRAIADLAAAQSAILPEMKQIAELKQVGTTLGQDMRDLGERLVSGFSRGFEMLDNTNRSLQASQANLLGALSSSHAQMASSLSEVIVKVDQKDARVAQDQVADMLSKHLTEIADRMAGGETDRARHLTMQVETDRQILATLAALHSDLVSERSDQARQMETVLADGLAEIAHNMEAAFSTFAQIVNLSSGQRNDSSDEAGIQFSHRTIQRSTPSNLPAGGFAEALQRRQSAERSR